MQELPIHYQQAIKAGIDASFVLMNYYSNGFSYEDKADGSPVTEADKASSDLIHSRLKETGIPIIGEEIINLPYEERKSWTKNWCVDPLDGTKEFIKKNGEFAINIAFIENQRPTFGIIVAPVRKEIIVGGKNEGVFILTFDETGTITSSKQIQTKDTINHPLVLLASRSYNTPETDRYVTLLEQDFGLIDYKQRGSALKFFDLALNTADIYPRFAPTMEWDIAAGQAIIEALEGEVLNFETKEPLIYNKEDLHNPHFIAKTKALRYQCLAKL
jgi:3'(2'), 5'-bisphosphate nucleotidase